METPNPAPTNRKIIGIDPGTTVFGYAIIEVITPQQLHVESCGVVQLHKLANHYEKLQRIFEKVTMLINTYQPTEMAIEAPFFGENVQAMLKLGRAQGVAMVAAMLKGVSVEEYSPRKLKQSVTGNGNASKEQVAAMLQQMLKIDTLPNFLDATDALGVAVCHHLQTKLTAGSGQPAKKFKDWKSFLNDKSQSGEILRYAGIPARSLRASEMPAYQLNSIAFNSNK